MEGQYLELCNDMKIQYDNIKKKHTFEIAKKNRIISEKDELIAHLKALLQSQPYKTGQFESIRPSADIARYSSVMGMMTDFQQ